MKKYKVMILLLNIILIIVGYLLWTILIPIQDIDLLSTAELLELQKEIAINYQIGKILMWVGLCGVLISISLFIKRNNRK